MFLTGFALSAAGEGLRTGCRLAAYWCPATGVYVGGFGRTATFAFRAFGVGTARAGPTVEQVGPVVQLAARAFLVEALIDRTSASWLCYEIAEGFADAAVLPLAFCWCAGARSHTSAYAGMSLAFFIGVTLVVVSEGRPNPASVCAIHCESLFQVTLMPYIVRLSARIRFV